MRFFAIPFIFFALTISISTITVPVAYADSSVNNTGTMLINPLSSTQCAGNGTCLMEFLQKIVDFIIKIGSVVIILMMVFIGFKFVTAQGDPGEIGKAREMLLYTVIGALLLLGAKAISLGIEATVRALGTGN